MTYSSKRRTLLLAAATAPLALTVAACASRQTAAPDEATAAAVTPAAAGQMLAEPNAARAAASACAIDIATGRRVEHRQNERFPFCSTFKAMLSAAVLAQSVDRPALLQQRVMYTQADLVNYSPVSGKHVDDGMTVAALCEATIQYSDNSAANLLMKLLGGPSAVTAYARSIGDDTFRLDRWETELNTALPGDPRDTTTPAAMAASMRVLMVGEALPAAACAARRVDARQQGRRQADPCGRAGRVDGRRQDGHRRLRDDQRRGCRVVAVGRTDRAGRVLHAGACRCAREGRRDRVGRTHRGPGIRLRRAARHA